MLLVDDDVDACDMLADLFGRRGVRTRCAYNGGDAIELLDQLAQTPESLPGVVVTDLIMPGIVGTSVVAFLQDDPRLRTIPIAIVTASPTLAPPGHLLLPKPLEVPKLIDFVNDRLSRTTLDRGRVAEA